MGMQADRGFFQQGILFDFGAVLIVLLMAL